MADRCLRVLWVTAVAAGCAASTPEVTRPAASEPLAEAAQKAEREPRAQAEERAEPPKRRFGQVSQQAHLFWLRTANPELCGQKLFDMASLVGEEVKTPRQVVLSFAAFWCEPCKKELAHFARERAALEATGAALAVVLIDEDREQLKKMTELLVEDYRLPFPVLQDWTRIVARKYGIEKLPHTVIIGQDGIIRWVRNGYDETKTLPGLLAAIRTTP